jgi:hypothetical protein
MLKAIALSIFFYFLIYFFMKNFLRLSNLENREIMDLVNNSLKFKSFFDSSSKLKRDLDSFGLDNFK